MSVFVNSVIVSCIFRYLRWRSSWDGLWNYCGMCGGDWVIFLKIWFASLKYILFAGSSFSCYYFPSTFLLFLSFYRGLIVPSREIKKEKKSKLMRKLVRSKNDNVVPHSQRVSGMVGLLDTMKTQLEVVFSSFCIIHIF